MVQFKKNILLLLPHSFLPFSIGACQVIEHSYIDHAYIETPILSQNDTNDVGPSSARISKRLGSFPGNNLQLASDYELRLSTIRRQIRHEIPKAIKSVEKDIEEANINRCVLAVSNFLGAWFGVMLGLNGVFTLSTVAPGPKLQASAQALYGYGYVAPFALEYEKTRLDCGLRDFDLALQEFAFLDHPAQGTPIALLTYYSTKLNHEIKRKVGCITNKQGSNDEARVVNGLIDIYTELQQERLAQL